MSQTKKAAVKELLAEKNYDAARVVLQSMQDDSQAKQVLFQLNERYPATASERSPRTRPLNLLTLLFLLVIIAVVGIAGAFLGRELMGREIAARLSNPVADSTPTGLTIVQQASVVAGNEPITTNTPSATGKWRLTETKSSLDDSLTRVLSLDAEVPVQTWLNKVTPTLIVRCKANELEAYTSLKTQVEAEGLTDVKVRFDKGRVQAYITSKSTSGDALFWRLPKVIVSDMFDHKDMVYGFTPYNSGPTEALFDVSGLRTAYGPLIKDCPLE